MSNKNIQFWFVNVGVAQLISSRIFNVEFRIYPDFSTNQIDVIRKSNYVNKKELFWLVNIRNSGLKIRNILLWAPPLISVMISWYIVCIQGPSTQIDAFQVNTFSWLDDIIIKTKIFLKSSDREIWYKTFNLGIHIV